ncbi:MAG: ribosome maturation factor RimM [Solirubrobacteraceae bacterium]
MTGQAGEEQEGRATGGGAPAGMGVGRVGRSHGLDGSFYVTRPRARLLSLGTPVSVAGRTAEIVRRAGTEKHPIVRIEGIDSREGAEALRGQELTVDSSLAPKLEEGEWWAHELEGCVVMDGERLLGRVERLLELPSCEALEVRPPDGGTSLLVPMVKDAIRKVEPAQGRIEVDSGFLDVEPPGSTTAAHHTDDATPAQSS